MTQSKTNNIEKRLEDLRSQRDAIDLEICAIYKQSADGPEEEKICPDFMAKALSRPNPKLKYPAKISGIDLNSDGLLDLHEPFWVAVRPCNKKYDKTYLGIMLGKLPLSLSAYINNSTNILHVSGALNPAIYVPDINKIIFGAGSWWKKISTPEDLKQITDKDIDNVWYVRATKELIKNK